MPLIDSGMLHCMCIARTI